MTDAESVTKIHRPMQRLIMPAAPCNPRKRRPLIASEQTNGRLIVKPMTIMPTMDPIPNTAIAKSPGPMAGVVERIMSISAADPANPCAMPMHNGRSK